MKFAHLIILLALTSCSCSHTRTVQSATNASYKLSDSWEIVPIHPSFLLEPSLETTVLVNEQTKVIVIFTTMPALGAEDVMIAHYLNISNKENVETARPTSSTLIKNGHEFIARATGSQLHFITVDGSKYTYVIQILTKTSDKLDEETVRLIKSFKVE